MNSINQHQPELNRKDLQGIAAVEKIKTLAEAAKTCFFCTGIRTGQQPHVRPMAVQKVDDAGTLWFLSATDSHTNAEVAASPVVQLLFQGSAYSDFMTLTGAASVSLDRNKIRELWEPLLKTWFTEGEDDPRISVISVQPQEGYYWDNKHGNMVAFAKQMIGALVGQTLDDSIEGTLQV